MKYKAWWQADRLRNLGEDVWPGIPEHVRAVAALIPRAPKVLEFGCGAGRLAPLFDREAYLGVDLNPEALELARRRNPGYAFREVDELEQLPPADVVFAHTVLLHVAGDDLPATLDQLAAAARRTIVVAEIMDPAWSRTGRWYQRPFARYQVLLRNRGFAARLAGAVPDPRYARDRLGRSDLVSVLVADRTSA